MNNILRQIEMEDVVIFKECQYNSFERNKYLDFHAQLMIEGKIKTSYYDMIWICSNGVKQSEPDFNLNEFEYTRHIGKEFGISYPTMINMLKCYVLYTCGEFIVPTIQMRLNGIKKFLTCFGNNDLVVKDREAIGIIDFLGYISTPQHQLELIHRQMNIKITPKSKPRELANLTNYIAIDNEIGDMYIGDISDEEFIRWFPVFFWTKVTFILPLRATEMLVTPYNCIERTNGEVYIKVRRSLIKKGKRNVYYDVDKDYRIFEYRFPDSRTIKTIEKYQQLTSHHKRRFLFDFGVKAINKILSLSSFNFMLEEFVNDKIVGNAKYAYAKYAAGIKEFELVSAGDSRPIAMSNLYYQDAGSDICRQLADHMNLNTSEGYYQNVSKTVQASSIMQYQQRINRGYDTSDQYQYIYGKNVLELPEHHICSSSRQPFVTGDISDCVAEAHIEECLGCRYYMPSDLELNEALQERKVKLESASKVVVKCMTDGMGVKCEDFDKVFLEAHMSIMRYKTACDEKAKKEELIWRRHRPIVTIS